MRTRQPSRTPDAAHWAQLCLEEATRFTNVLHSVVGEGETGYTASSSTLAVAHSLLAARDRSEFPRRLHHAFNEFIGRPTSQFHLEHAETLSQIAFDSYEAEGTSSVFPVGASRTGLSILTERFLARTKFIDTIIYMVAHGLDHFFDTVVRTETGAACNSTADEAQPGGHRYSELEHCEHEPGMKRLLALPPRLERDDVLTTASSGLSAELGWALLQVVRHRFCSSRPELRTMPQPTLPVAVSMEHARQVAETFERLGIDKPSNLEAVKQLLDQIDGPAVEQLAAKTRVRVALALLEETAKLVPGESLLNADILTWRALAATKFAQVARRAADAQVVTRMRRALESRVAALKRLRHTRELSRTEQRKADSPLAEHYELRVAFLEPNRVRVREIAKRILRDWPSEYPAHIDFFAQWKLWADAVKRNDMIQARCEWDVLYNDFQLFCENELPLHMDFVEAAEPFGLGCGDSKIRERLICLLKKASQMAAPHSADMRALARKVELTLCEPASANLG